MLMKAPSNAKQDAFFGTIFLLIFLAGDVMIASGLVATASPMVAGLFIPLALLGCVFLMLTGITLRDLVRDLISVLKD